jgi:hypothetical protein
MAKGAVFAATPALDQAPALTLPPEAAKAVRVAYRAARVILEYGSGGSTALAADMPGKTVFSVESDGAWATGLRDWFTANPPKADKVVVHHANVGPTGKWGMPTEPDHWQNFHDYPLSVWRLPDFEHPDAVLVDGRFRAACFLHVLFAITRPVTLLFDDYTVRPVYHGVERFAKPVRLHGRMAEFRLEPTRLQNGDLPFILEQFTKVR